MPNKELELLLKKAISLQIEGLEGVGHAVPVQTLIKVLTRLQSSFNNYIEVGIQKNPDLAQGKEITPELVTLIQDKLQLLILKVQPGSVVMRMAPDMTNLQGYLFAKSAADWQAMVFESYKQEVVAPAYTPSFIDSIAEKYNPEERKKIYRPFFEAVGLGQEKVPYRINLVENTEKIKVIKTLELPEKKEQKLIIPSVRTPIKVEEEDGLVLARIKTTNGKPHVSNIYSVVNQTFSSIPYPIERIAYKHKEYILSKKITGQMRKEENVFFLEYKDLDIEVWGESHSQVLEAFGFAFNSLYRNFVTVKESELTPKAIILRGKLTQLVKEVRS